MQEDNLHQKIQKMVAKIPLGKVASYGQIANLAGTKDARIVGWAIHKNKDAVKVPCHRVVKADGSLSEGYGMGGIEEQKRHLLEEGLDINGYKVDMTKYQWQPQSIKI